MALVEYRAAYELVLPHLPRARAVAFELDYERSYQDRDWDLPSYTLRQLLEKLSTTVMPLTTKLEVFHLLEDAPLEDIPKLALAKTMPALTVVRSSGVVYSWTNGITLFPPGLRTLSLWDSHCWWTVDEMIDILRTIPMLEDFIYLLEEPLIFEPGGTPALSRIHPPRCVELRRLRSFICEAASFMRSIMVFRYLSFPSTATLLIKFAERVRDQAAVRAHPVLFRDLVASSKDLIHAHFAPAIESGAFYPCLYFDKYGIKVEDRQDCTDDPKPLLPDGSDAQHLLPRNIQLGILQAKTDEPLPIHNSTQSANLNHALSPPLNNQARMLDTWASLPILAHARSLHFLPSPAFDAFDATFLAHFMHATEIHLSSWSMFVDKFYKLLLQPEVVYASSYWEYMQCEPGAAKIELFPALRTIHVECRPHSGSGARETIDVQLPLLIHLADELVSHWGSTLKHIVLHNSPALSDEAGAVSSLNSILGAECVVCEDEMLECCEYSKYAGEDSEEEGDDRPESARVLEY